MKEPEFNDKYAMNVLKGMIAAILLIIICVAVFGCTHTSGDIPRDSVNAIDQFLLHLPKKQHAH